MGAPNLKSGRPPEDRQGHSPSDSFESWARSLEAAGLTFDASTKRWNILQGRRNQERVLRLNSLALIYRRSHILAEQVSYKINLQRWAKLTQNAAKEIFGPRTRAELHTDIKSGRPDCAWMVLEFTRPDSRDASMGYSHLFDYRHFQSGFLVIRIKFQIAPAGFNLKIQEIAQMGYLPPETRPRITRFMRRSLGLGGVARMAPLDADAKKDDSLDFVVPVAELLHTSEVEAANKIQAALNDPKVHENSNLSKIQGNLDGGGDLVWEFLFSGQQDSLAATKSTQGSIEKNAINVKQEMVRPELGLAPFSPTLELSAKARILLNEKRPADALEVISSMVRSLHLEWPFFESSNIAVTMLSEILGDCWAAQPVGVEDGMDPFYRAKSAWERAAGIRANGLRIQRKIAYAARTHGHRKDEIKALQEIIKTEKRKKDLARSMLRLAQIGQDGSTNDDVEIASEQLVLDAAGLASDDELVNFACFQQMVVSGNFQAAWDFGRTIFNDPNKLHSPIPRAEVANTLGHISASEMGDDASALHFFREARREDPSSTKPLRGLAAIGARKNDIYIEIEALFELVDVLFDKAQLPEPDDKEIKYEITATALRILEIALAGSQLERTEILVDTNRVLALLSRSFLNQITSVSHANQWLLALEQLANRSDFTVLRTAVVRAFLQLSVPEDGPRPPRLHPGSVVRLVGSLITLTDLAEGKLILAAATHSLSGQRMSDGAVLPACDKLLSLIETLTLSHEHSEWMMIHGPEVFRILHLEPKIKILVQALSTTGIADKSWLQSIVSETILSHPPLSALADSPADLSQMTGLLKLILAGTEASFLRDDIQNATNLVFLALSTFPDVANVLLDTFYEEGSGNHRAFLLRAVAGSVIRCISKGVATPFLNSRFRSLILTIQSEFHVTPGNSAHDVASLLFASICRDGQETPLDEIEIEFILRPDITRKTPELLDCLLHQAMAHENNARASELYKICLDHAVLELHDEIFAARIIECWLARLQPRGILHTKTEEKVASSAETIDRLSIELIDLLKQLDPNAAESISNQLGNAGFIQPNDPISAIAGAYQSQKYGVARSLFKRSVIAAPGSRAEMAIRLFHALESLDFRAGFKKLGKSGIVEILLEWYGDPASGGGIPVTLALLAAKHLDDRRHARAVIEKLQSELISNHLEDQRLWIPLYMLLIETGSKAEVDQYLDMILPGLKRNPDLLSDFPFTVESLVAERLTPTMQGTASEVRAAEPEMILDVFQSVPENEEAIPGPQSIDLAFDIFEPEVAPAVEITVVPEPEAEAAPAMEITMVPEPEAEAAPAMEITMVPEPSPSEVVLPPPPQANDLLDWRTAVRNRRLGPGLTLKLLETEMPNKIEKHLALQAVALMRGETQILERWDWRVWRKPHEYAYSRQGKDRFPPGLSPRIMKTPTFKLLLQAAPLLARSFPERFTIHGLAKSLGTSGRKIESKRQRLDWSTGLAGYAGFGYHAKVFTERGLQLFSLQGLGPQVFYDATSSTIYIDDAFFARKPPTHLYHRVMYLLYSVRTQFHALLNLHPETQILAELNKLKSVMDRGPLAIFAAKAKLSDSRMAKVMKPQDFEEFKLLFSRVGPLNGDEISDAAKSMQQYLWRLLLADSLDLTGIIEAMLDLDLMLPGSVKPGEILLMSAQVDPLINFALALNLEMEASKP